MWYVLETSAEGKVYHGFLHDTNRDEVKSWIEGGTLVSHIREILVSSDSVLLIDASSIHGLGKGMRIVEIEENSDITYRLWDWERHDENGLPRELHIDKGLDVLRYTQGKDLQRPMRQIAYRPGISEEFIGRCCYFDVYRVLINSQKNLVLESRVDSYEMWFCIKGQLILSARGMESIKMAEGSCVFIPAGSAAIHVTGSDSFLKIHS